LILAIEQLLAPPNPTDLRPGRLPDFRFLVKKISFCLPTHGWIALDKPINDDIAHEPILQAPTRFSKPGKVTSAWTA
jgi:hypothetical protein